VEDAFERACGEDGLVGESELLQLAAEMGVSLQPAQARAMLIEVSRDRDDIGFSDGSAAAAQEPRIRQKDAVKLMQGQ
jgi:hypothetical protein